MGDRRGGEGAFLGIRQRRLQTLRLAECRIGSGRASPSPGGDSGVSVGQHQEGEGEQKAEQDKQEGAYAPDGCQDADDFVFACLWFHKD